MIKSRALPAALTAGAIAALVAVLPAHGQDTAQARTLTFTSTEKDGDEHAIDTRPNGPSVGDRWLLATTLRQAGKLAGRLEADCVGVDKTYGVLQCTVVVILRDGRLTLHGASVSKRIPGVGGMGRSTPSPAAPASTRAPPAPCDAPETTRATRSPSPSPPDTRGRRGANLRGDQTRACLRPGALVITAQTTAWTTRTSAPRSRVHASFRPRKAGAARHDPASRTTSIAGASASRGRAAASPWMRASRTQPSDERNGR